MKLLTLSLATLSLSGCAVIASPISYYQCSSNNETISKKISLMDESFNNLSDTVNKTPYISDKNAFIYYNKLLVDTVNIKIQNDKYLSDEGDYSTCANNSNSTIKYIDSLTIYFDKTNSIIKNTTKMVPEMKKNLNCQGSNCDEQLNDKFKSTIDSKVNRLNSI